MTKVIALFNMSGGVGKSTLTMNLSYHMQQEQGISTLAIDMDPQASLTTFMGLDPFSFEETVLNSLIEETPLPVIPSDDIDNLWCDVAPANIYLAQAELQLAAALRREYRLREAIESMDNQYDVILIDSPPSLGLLSINCLVASDYLLVPIQTEYKSVEATTNLLKTTFELSQKVNRALRVIGVVPTMHDERTSQAKRALQAINDIFEQLRQAEFFKHTEIFKPIPRRTDVSNAQSEHMPLALYARRHDALDPLRTIAAKLGEQL